jgi:predicted nucleotidyltransferase component of viral defense system
MTSSVPQAIECLHLGFLAVLRTRLDESRYVLKGGVNLRYFFGSVRYSEDIDLDVNGVPGWKLEERIDKTLASDALAIVLRSAGLRVLTEETTKPKQTDTTRRWKVQVAAEGLRNPVRARNPGARRLRSGHAGELL